MKKEELVKLGIEEELAAKIEAASLEELKGYIPKTRFDEVNNEKKKLEADVKERDKQLESLKTSTGDVEEMKKQIQQLQDDNKAKEKEHANEIKQLKIENAIEAALTGAKAKNNAAVRALLKDLDKAEIAEDGTIKGLAEQIEALQKSDSYLFTEGKTTMKGATPGQGSDKGDTGLTKEQFTKMSYKQKVDLFNTNKELYESLTKE